MTDNSRWTLWRQDDNGSSAVIATSLTKEAAKARMAELEARGHKQHYWIEEDTTDERVSGRPNRRNRSMPN